MHINVSYTILYKDKLANEGVKNIHAKICHIGMLTILSYRHLRNSRCKKMTRTYILSLKTRRWNSMWKSLPVLEESIIFIIKDRKLRQKKKTIQTNIVRLTLEEPFQALLHQITYPSPSPFPCYIFTFCYSYLMQYLSVQLQLHL